MNLLIKAWSAITSNNIAQSCIQSGLEILQGWSLYTLPAQPAPLSNCPHINKFFLLSIPNLSFQLISTVSHPSTMHCDEQPGSLFSIISLLVQGGDSIKSFQKPSLLQAEEVQVPQPLLLGHVLQAPDCLGHLLNFQFSLFCKLDWGFGKKLKNTGSLFGTIQVFGLLQSSWMPSGKLLFLLLNINQIIALPFLVEQMNQKTPKLAAGLNNYLQQMIQKFSLRAQFLYYFSD